MRFYRTEHPFYCGVDLHARKMYVTVVDQAGTTREQRNLDAGPEPFLSLVRLAAKLARAVYWMLKRQEAFDVNKCFKN